MWLGVVFSLAILVLAIALVWSHVRSWQASREQGLEAVELDFAWRRCRRRVQASGMLALAALAMLAGLWTSPQRSPSLFVGWWFLVSVLVAWMMLLALADALATRQYYLRHKRRQLAESMSRPSLLRGRRQSGNGESKHP